MSQYGDLQGVAKVCCNREIDYIWSETKRVTKLHAKSAKILESRDGYPDGWYLMIGLGLSCPISHCPFCGKKLE